MRRLLLLAAACCAGCGGSSPADYSVSAHDPALKIPAMKRAAEQQDTSKLQELVRSLGSDDPAIRFYGIETLRRMTGDDLDYHYYGTEESRREAIGRWNAWLNEQPSASTTAPSKP